jgi:hypothetical protein
VRRKHATQVHRRGIFDRNSRNLAPDNSRGASTIRLVLQQNSSTDLTVFDRLVSHRQRTIGGIHQPEIGWMDNAVISRRYWQADQSIA